MSVFPGHCLLWDVWNHWRPTYLGSFLLVLPVIYFWQSQYSPNLLFLLGEAVKLFLNSSMSSGVIWLILPNGMWVKTESRQEWMDFLYSLFFILSASTCWFVLKMEQSPGRSLVPEWTLWAQLLLLTCHKHIWCIVSLRFWVWFCLL